MTLKDAHRINFSLVPIETEMWMVGGEMGHLKQQSNHHLKKSQTGGVGGGGSIATYDMLPCWIFGYCWRT